MPPLPHKKNPILTVGGQVQAGSLWGNSPVVQADGTVVEVRHEGGKNVAYCVAWDPIEKGRLGLGDSRGNVYILNIKRNRFSLLQRCGHSVIGMVFSTAKRSEIIVSLENRTILVLNVEKGRVGHTLRGHQSKATKLHFSSPHLSLLTSSATDSTIVWCTPYSPGSPSDRFDVKYSLKTSSYPSVDVATSAKHLLTVHATALCVWDLAGPNLIKEIAPPVFPSSSQVPPLTMFDTISLTRGGEHLAAGGRGSPTVVIYDLTTFRMNKALQVMSNGSGVVQLEFFVSGDETRLAALSTDGSVLIIRPFHKTATLSNVITKPNIFADSIALAGDQYLTLVGCGTVHILHLPTACVYASFKAADPTPSSETTLVSTMRGMCDSTVPTFIAPQGALLETSLEANPNESGKCVSYSIPLQSSLASPVDWMRSDLRAKKSLSEKQPVDAALATLYSNQNRRFAHGPTGRTSSRAVSLRQSVVKRRRNPHEDCLRELDKNCVDEELRLQAKLDQKAITLNSAKLRRMLLSYGQYPDKYRTLIWRFLLRTSSETAGEGFTTLLHKGRHDAVPVLLKEFPLNCAKLKQAMVKVLECLCHHCPPLSVTSWLPELVFPITKAFGSNVKAAFEVTLVFLQNWGQAYLANYPHYSYPAVLLIDSLLEQLDPETLEVLRDRGCPVEWYAWSPMTTLFTDLLSTNEWLQVMDHVFSNQPIWLFLFHVAYLSAHKEVFRASTTGEAFFKVFFTKNNPADINKVIHRTYTLHRKVNLDALPSECGAGKYQTFTPMDAGKPYPVITDYPEVTINSAVQDRERIIAEEVHLIRIRRNTEELGQQLLRSEEDHEKRIQELNHRSEAAQTALEMEAERHQEMVALKEKVMQEQNEMRLRKAALQHRAAGVELEINAAKHSEALGRFHSGVESFAAAVSNAQTEAAAEDLLLRVEERAQRQYEHAVRWIADVPTFSDNYTDIPPNAQPTKAEAQTQVADDDIDNKILSELEKQDRATATDPWEPPVAPRYAVHRNVLTPSEEVGQPEQQEPQSSPAETPEPEPEQKPDQEVELTPEPVQEPSSIQQETQQATASEETVETIPGTPPHDAVNVLTKIMEREIDTNYQSTRAAIIRGSNDGSVTPATTPTTTTVTTTTMTTTTTGSSTSKTTPTSGSTVSTLPGGGEGGYEGIIKRMRMQDEVFKKMQQRNQEEVEENTRMMRKLEETATALMKSTSVPAELSFAVSSLSNDSPIRTREREVVQALPVVIGGSPSTPSPGGESSALTTSSASSSSSSRTRPFHDPFLPDATPDTIDPSGEVTADSLAELLNFASASSGSDPNSSLLSSSLS
eukprot:TRINITY_DN9664_c0_g3_i1.p1 TRINITY_DN9664_c0_g3~~TRINITY_DN9664_c0_g3_i1.p1  ORF type:complete len:1344 (+),score=337.37 TRINITY_DN9664_c0_g3_i1:52-4032(+)